MVKKHLLHLHGVPPSELTLQSGALEAQPQRALLCRGARQALTTLRTTVAHEALHATSEIYAALRKPHCHILQWQRWAGAMLGHQAEPHRPVDAGMPTGLHTLKARLPPHQEREPRKARAAPQTAESAAALLESRRLALQGPCCEECAGTKAWANRTRVPQTLKEPLKWAGEERIGKPLLVQSRCHLITAGASQDLNRQQYAHGKDVNLLTSLFQIAVRARFSQLILGCGQMQLAEIR